MTQPHTMQLALAERKQDSGQTVAGAAQADFSMQFEAYYARVFRYIRYRVGCRFAAEDLASQVFEKAWARHSSYREDKAPFEVWLFAIARNTVNDYARQQKRHRLFSLEALKDAVSGAKSPESEAIDGEARDKLLSAMGVLKPVERCMLALKFGAELKNREIAGLSGKSESNVGVTLYRAMKKLKAELERMGCHE